MILHRTQWKKKIYVTNTEQLRRMQLEHNYDYQDDDLDLPLESATNLDFIALQSIPDFIIIQIFIMHDKGEFESTTQSISMQHCYHCDENIIAELGLKHDCIIVPQPTTYQMKET